MNQITNRIGMEVLGHDAHKKKDVNTQVMLHTTPPAVSRTESNP